MQAAEQIPFVKMHGSGNDFVVIDHRDPMIDDADLAEFAQAVCRRGMSVGADGVILIINHWAVDFAWRYINADGSDGDMCGNGAMVGARYAVDHGIAGERCTFQTPAGLVTAHVQGDQVTLEMMDASFMGADGTYEAMPGVMWDEFMIGVPHVVGVVADADEVSNLHETGRAIRHAVEPAGANVNVIHRIDDHSIRMRTYERGVEAETLACGTGAVCSAISAVQRGLVEQPVDVRVSSGMDLRVSWEQRGNMFTNIRLAGTARVVARGDIWPEALA